MTKKQITKEKKAEKKQISAGRIFVTATFNNTLVSLTDTSGHVLSWSSSGHAGFKGARKATPFAAITAVEKVAQAGKNLGLSTVEVYIKGPGSGRDAAIRALRNAGLQITMIADITPMAHNGPKAPNKRRA